MNEGGRRLPRRPPSQTASAEHADDRAVQWGSPLAADERGISVVEDTSIGGHEVVPQAGDRRRDAHDRLVEPEAAGGSEEPGIAVVEDPGVGGDQAVTSAAR